MRPIAQAVRELLAERRQGSKDVIVSCSGKERYATFEMAQRVAKRVTRKHDRVDPYRCCFCRGFHIGHPNPG